MTRGADGSIGENLDVEVVFALEPEDAAAGVAGRGLGGRRDAMGRIGRRDGREQQDDGREDERKDPRATTEGSEATAEATNHDGPARGDPFYCLLLLV